MRKYLTVLLLAAFSATIALAQNATLEQAMQLLKNRKDNQAMVIFEEVLLAQPDNLDAAWGKAEVLRRSRNYQDSQELLDRILAKNPQYAPALISLAYIRYKDNKFNEAIKLVNQALKIKNLNKEDRAMAYMMAGTINARRSSKGWLMNKVVYGTQVKGYFLKAAELAPDLPEVHLGLGTFYLLAPSIAGGSPYKARKELELTIQLAPDFATPYARLAQYYKRIGDPEGYRINLEKAKELDPDNEVFIEIENEKSGDL